MKLYDARQTPSEFALFTGGKTADLAIFFNLAEANLKKIIQHYEKKEVKLSKFRESPAEKLKSQTYSALAEYMWKAHAEMRNKNEWGLKPGEKELIEALLAKLNEIRNFQSHIWHDNKPLTFDINLKKFVTEKFEKALAAALEKDYDAAITYKQNGKFPLFDKANRITQEGRIFFLSFFLTTGQMSQLLQQRRGSKRTDAPLYKVKHIIYKYYCHRDGASISGFHHQESLLHQMEAADRGNILKARQAYKIVNYLYDFPDYFANNEDIPLLLPAPETEEKVRKINTVHELLEFVQYHAILKDFEFIPLYGQYKDDENSKETFIKNRSICIRSNDIPEYDFHISFDDLYKLIMLCLKYGETAPVSRLCVAMRRHADHRNRLTDILLKNRREWNDNDDAYINNRANQYLRSYRKTTERGISFFEKYVKEKTITEKEMRELANRIGSKGNEREEEPDAILLYSQDFIEKTDQKFRPGNKFMQYATKYLIDLKITTWYWEAEKFSPGDENARNGRIKEFQKEINVSADWRLCTDKDHVVIGIPKKEIPNNLLSTERHNYFYRFRLGPRAMRYLLAYHFTNNNADINCFLSDVLKQDVEDLHRYGPTAKFKLLEPQFIPSYMKNNDSTKLAEHVKKIDKRILHIIRQWDNALQQLPFLSRSMKNKLVMDCYRLYDWRVNGEVKFLRKNEYAGMSICHYTIGHKNRKPGERKAKFHHLFEDVFALNKRKPAIPKEVIDLLNDPDIDNLDKLVQHAIKSRKEYLTDAQNLLALLPNRKKKEHAIELSKRIGLSIPTSLLNEEAENKRLAERAHTRYVQSFDIHPVLLLKHFDKAGYNTEYENTKGVSRKGNGIFRNVRNRPGLHNAHYDTSFTEKIAVDSDNPDVQKVYARQIHKWIERINITKTEDALLWQIAQSYLINNPYTESLGSHLKQKGTPEVGSIHKAKVKIRLQQGTGSQNQDDTLNKPLYVEAYMHQLDDIMFTQDKEKLRRAALHFLLRHSEEKEHWQLTETILALSQQGADYIYSESSGTIDNPIPYQIIRLELQLVTRHGKNLAQYLLDWERVAILTACREVNDIEKQLSLQQHAEYSGDCQYISFKKVVELSCSSVNEIEGFRNRIFHSGVPVSKSYSYWARPEGEAGKILGITTPLNQSKDRSKHDTNNMVPCTGTNKITERV